MCSAAPDGPNDDSIIQYNADKVLYSSANSGMHAICIEDNEAQQDAAHRIINIEHPSTIRRWSEVKVIQGITVVRIPKEKVNHVHHN